MFFPSYRLVYNPGEGTVVGDVFLGTTATGEPVSSLTLHETLPEGTYRVGFDADSDGNENDGINEFKSYFTSFCVNDLCASAP